MSHRRNIHQVARIPVGPGPAGDGRDGIRQITVDLRMFWPYDIDPTNALEVLDACYDQIRDEVREAAIEFAARSLPSGVVPAEEVEKP